MMIAQELTKRQKEVLSFIIDYIQQHQCPPSIREVAGRLGCTVKGAYDHLRALERKGWIKREGKHSRGIKILEYPDEYFHLKRQQVLMKMDIRAIPLVGRVPAGKPQTAIMSTDEYFVLGGSYLARDLHFALKVQGDSMVGAGILDGDIVIVRHQSTAQHGDIVVVLIEGVEEEATLKRFLRAREGVVLKPENPRYKPQLIKDPSQLKISGVVVGLYRSFR